MALIEVDLRPPLKNLRVFGWAAVVVFGGLGVLVHLTGGLPFWKFPGAAPTVAVVLWSLAGLSGLFSLAAPALNRPLYVFLILLSVPIGLVVSYAVLIVLFYGIMTPLGILFRLFGRDALKRRFVGEAKTYWEPHVAPAGVDRYFKQF
jgi:hypothetical protein